jgi:hypothetical protein
MVSVAVIHLQVLRAVVRRIVVLVMNDFFSP